MDRKEREQPERHFGLLDDFADEKELARELKKSLRTVRRMRMKRVGPPWTLNGNKVLYHVPAVREWLRLQEVQPVRGRRR
jgi:hypothetical protein